MSNVLSSLAFLSVIGLLAYVGWGLEPHWASKDGVKFMCRMQEYSDDPGQRPRWHDVKVKVDDGELLVSARARKSSSLRGVWKVVAAVSVDEKNRRLYEVRSTNDVNATLRVPQSSRCVPLLDRLVP